MASPGIRQPLHSRSETLLASQIKQSPAPPHHAQDKRQDEKGDRDEENDGESLQALWRE